MLRISPDLELPLDGVTQKFAWLGRSGGGKSYGLKRFVEQMLHTHRVQVIIVDTVGIWYGLRQGPKGFAVPVLGGIHGDIPLEPSSGALVAEVAVGHRSSMVLDTSQMTDGQRAKFAEHFGRRLFELKKSSPSAMHIVLDEGQDIVPQNFNDGEKMMLHEWVRIAKQGRAFGIGLSIATQRPQEVNKKALNQAECVFAFQLTGSHERKAVEYWLADKGLETKLSDTLTTLEIGRPFVWSPQWLKMSRIIERISPIESADTSATPKVGEAPRAAGSMKPIDLGALRISMAAATEELKENDPKALKEEVKHLRAQLAEGAPIAAIDQALVDELVATLGRTRKDQSEAVFASIGTVMDIEETCRKLHVELDHIKSSLDNDDSAMQIEKLCEGVRKLKPRIAPQPVPERPCSVAKQKTPVEVHREESKAHGLASGELATLSAIARKKGGAARAFLVLVTGLRKASIETYVQRLVTRGLVKRGSGMLLFATAEGFGMLPPQEELPTGAALIEHYKNTLPGGESTVFGVVATAHPKLLSRDTLIDRTKLSPASVETYVQKLVTRGLLEREPEKKVRLHQEFSL